MGRVMESKIASNNRRATKMMVYAIFVVGMAIRIIIRNIKIFLIRNGKITFCSAVITDIVRYDNCSKLNVNTGSSPQLVLHQVVPVFFLKQRIFV